MSKIALFRTDDRIAVLDTNSLEFSSLSLFVEDSPSVQRFLPFITPYQTFFNGLIDQVSSSKGSSIYNIPRSSTVAVTGFKSSRISGLSMNPVDFEDNPFYTHQRIIMPVHHAVKAYVLLDPYLRLHVASNGSVNLKDNTYSFNSILRSSKANMSRQTKGIKKTTSAMLTFPMSPEFIRQVQVDITCGFPVERTNGVVLINAKQEVHSFLTVKG